jgi:hypothetical protein
MGRRQGQVKFQWLCQERWLVVLEHCEISNFKHQITNKSQIPIFNDQNKKQVWSAGGGLVPPSADYLLDICDL